MKRTLSKLGDVFSVDLDHHTQRLFQFIALDLTQLNSDVIRVFKEPYPVTDDPNFEEIVRGPVDFHAHTVVKWGVRNGLWRKIGKATLPTTTDVLFRDSTDYGDPCVTLSERWYIWKINGPFKDVGRLTGSNRNADIGVVISPDSVVARIKTGTYDFVYPGFE